MARSKKIGKRKNQLMLEAAHDKLTSATMTKKQAQLPDTTSDQWLVVHPKVKTGKGLASKKEGKLVPYHVALLWIQNQTSMTAEEKRAMVRKINRQLDPAEQTQVAKANDDQQMEPIQSLAEQKEDGTVTMPTKVFKAIKKMGHNLMDTHVSQSTVANQRIREEADKREKAEDKLQELEQMKKQLEEEFKNKVKQLEEDSVRQRIAAHNKAVTIHNAPPVPLFSSSSVPTAPPVVKVSVKRSIHSDTGSKKSRTVNLGGSGIHHELMAELDKKTKESEAVKRELESLKASMKSPTLSSSSANYADTVMSESKVSKPASLLEEIKKTPKLKKTVATKAEIKEDPLLAAIKSKPTLKKTVQTKAEIEPVPLLEAIKAKPKLKKAAPMNKYIPEPSPVASIPVNEDVEMKEDSPLPKLAFKEKEKEPAMPIPTTKLKMTKADLLKEYQKLSPAELTDYLVNGHVESQVLADVRNILKLKTAKEQEEQTKKQQLESFNNPDEEINPMDNPKSITFEQAQSQGKNSKRKVDQIKQIFSTPYEQEDSDNPLVKNLKKTEAYELSASPSYYSTVTKSSLQDKKGARASHKVGVAQAQAVKRTMKTSSIYDNKLTRDYGVYGPKTQKLQGVYETTPAVKIDSLDYLNAFFRR